MFIVMPACLYINTYKHTKLCIYMCRHFAHAHTEVEYTKIKYVYEYT